MLNLVLGLRERPPATTTTETMVGAASSKLADLKAAVLRRMGLARTAVQDALEAGHVLQHVSRRGLSRRLRIDRFDRLRAVIGYDLAAEILQQLCDRVAERYSRPP